MPHPDNTQKFKKIAQNYWDYYLQSFPEVATFYGNSKYDDLLEEFGPDKREKDKDAISGFLKDLQSIEPSTLNNLDSNSYRILKLDLNNFLEEHEFAPWEWNIDQIYGPHMRLLDLLETHPLQTRKNYDDLLERYSHIPRYFMQYIGELKAGLKSGRTASKIAYDRVLKQLEEFLKKNIRDLHFSKPIRDFPKDFSPSEKSKLTEEFEDAIRSWILPSYAEFYNFLKTDYQDKARKNPGIWALPEGLENYAFKCRQMTTTNLTPAELHKIGLEELQKNNEEILSIASKMGNDSGLPQFLDRIKKDPAQYFKTSEEIVTMHQTALQRMQKLLPQYFGTLPTIPFEIKEIDAFKALNSPAAFYYPPTTDGSRPGVFWVNTHNPSQWAIYSMETLAYHEAIPGHHFQIALAMENKDLPLFQRHGAFTAYVEGWAHYTERIANEEMNAYSSDLQRVGMLLDQAWRAVRLVVDTGVHHFQWSREKAFEFMKSTRAAHEMEMNNEIDRYIVWPGQALAYKVGQRTFSDLKNKAKQKLGAAFDIRKFHDAVLLQGAMPLFILEEIVDLWIGSQIVGKQSSQIQP
ncbi:MAG: DUF885 domain-containing protein [Deltaproteobacteria bacterium]|nr:DUF885 domain-containing protein [Deltaproteobacteria bacterium]